MLSRSPSPPALSNQAPSIPNPTQKSNPPPLPPHFRPTPPQLKSFSVPHPLRNPLPPITFHLLNRPRSPFPSLGSDPPPSTPYSIHLNPNQTRPHSKTYPSSFPYQPRPPHTAVHLLPQLKPIRVHLPVRNPLHPPRSVHFRPAPSRRLTFPPIFCLPAPRMTPTHFPDGSWSAGGAAG